MHGARTRRKCHTFYVMLWLGMIIFNSNSVSSASVPGAISINCGGPPYTDSLGNRWLGDSYYEGGSPTVLSSSNSDDPGLSTYRSFPPNSGGISCYEIPSDAQYYGIRLGFSHFGGREGTATGPKFEIFVEGVMVQAVEPNVSKTDIGNQLQVSYADQTFYTEHMLKVSDGFTDICLRPVEGTPFISTIELVPLDSDLFEDMEVPLRSIVTNHVRVNSGGLALGPPVDIRIWTADESQAEGQYKSVHVEALGQLALDDSVAQGPEKLPPVLFHKARESTAGWTGYGWVLNGVSELNDWVVRFYFCEVNSSVRIGDRVMDVFVNSVHVKRVDILQLTEGVHFKPVMLSLPFNLSLSTNESPRNLMVGLGRAAGSRLEPILAGVTVMEIIPAIATREEIALELKNYVPSLLAFGKSANRADLSVSDIIAIAIATTTCVMIAVAIALFLVLWRRQTDTLSQRSGGAREQGRGEERDEESGGAALLGFEEAPIEEEAASPSRATGLLLQPSPAVQTEAASTTQEYRHPRHPPCTRQLSSSSDRGQSSSSAPVAPPAPSRIRPRPRLEGLP
eukprot:TRINITY_DN11433_c0_g1_i1.p1 TRINITY_DN11433_c0_g1~~TRINITY_DN11433_c0_g1_i1.p1  ORF type:complete len:566 (+),score=43.17 TRINITY_DN11433_c0_g1_i1:702-2399(+)